MSESKSSSSSSGGVGFCGLLGVAFIVLKLCHVIDWTWLWVLAPLWIPLAIVLALFVFAGLCFAGAYILERKSR